MLILDTVISKPLGSLRKRIAKNPFADRTNPSAR